MARRIVIIDGHPDATAKRYIHALAKAYEKGAVEAGHEVRVAWADHLVIIYPLWLGSMPGMLKSFFEQLLRPGFAFAPAAGRGMPRKLLKGRSARIIVTMGMPALFYRWYFYVVLPTAAAQQLPHQTPH
jgi:putative NADPH-quinone reductase